MNMEDEVHDKANIGEHHALCFASRRRLSCFEDDFVSSNQSMLLRRESHVAGGGLLQLLQWCALAPRLLVQIWHWQHLPVHAAGFGGNRDSWHWSGDEERLRDGLQAMPSVPFFTRGWSLASIAEQLLDLDYAVVSIMPAIIC